jgi:Aminoglycoside-2''-adenylyltransferase
LADASADAEAGRQLDVIGTLHERFEVQGIDYWLFGGWAVDFHVGRVTRSHADIDLAVWKRDLVEVDRLLRRAGWRHRPQRGEDGYTTYANGVIHLDLAFLVRGSDGLVYTPLREGRGDWSRDAFGQDLAELEGVRARVVSRASLLADKSEHRDDPLAAMKDRADVVSLGTSQDQS